MINGETNEIMTAFLGGVGFESWVYWGEMDWTYHAESQCVNAGMV